MQCSERRASAASLTFIVRQEYENPPSNPPLSGVHLLTDALVFRGIGHMADVSSKLARLWPDKRNVTAFHHTHGGSVEAR